MPVHFHYGSDFFEFELFHLFHGFLEAFLDSADKTPDFVIVYLFSVLLEELVQLLLVAVEVLLALRLSTLLVCVWIVFVDLVFDELIDEAFAYAGHQLRIEVLQLVVSQQVANSVGGFVEL